MKMAPEVAETVVHRGPPTYRFDVDDAPFPWYVTERGPSFVQLLDDLWRVDVTILCERFGRRQYQHQSFSDVIFTDDEFSSPKIAGLTFPWTITSEGITYHRSNTTLATVRLGFYTKTVDTDSKHLDLRCRGGGLGGAPIYDLDGNIHGHRMSHERLEADVRLITKGEVLHP
jgi:hypothetical protein